MMTTLLQRSLALVLWGGSIIGGWLCAPLFEQEQVASLVSKPDTDIADRAEAIAKRCWQPLAERADQFAALGSGTALEDRVRGQLVIQGRAFAIRQDQNGHLYRALAVTSTATLNNHHHHNNREATSTRWLQHRANITTGITDDQLGEMARRTADAIDSDINNSSSNSISRCTGSSAALSKRDIASGSPPYDKQRLPPPSS